MTKPAMTDRFTKPFTQQEPLSNEAIESAINVMRGGRLHRYNVAEGETSQVSLLEQEFADYQGSKYCLACTSGGYALHIALKSAGLKLGKPVLTNAFTLAPVPGAIHNAGGKPILVETETDLTIDLTDLENKAKSAKAKFLMLSHMRGHIADMDAVTDICNRLNLFLIEDCAHTMGAKWKNTKSGNFGKIACFSSQTYKHLNSGEGGFLTTNNPEIMAKAVIHSGSYMLYDKHISRPETQIFETVKLHTPNYSGRMDNLRASILRVQLKQLDTNCKRWNERYKVLADGLQNTKEIIVPKRSKHEHFVASSFQFFLDTDHANKVTEFIDACANRGVEIKWFGADQPTGFTSRYDSWQYIESQPDLPKTRHILRTLCDMRIPLTFSLEDCELIAEIISQTARDIIES